MEQGQRPSNVPFGRDTATFDSLVGHVDRVREGLRVRMLTLCRGSLPDASRAQAQAASVSARQTALPRPVLGGFLCLRSMKQRVAKRTHYEAACCTAHLYVFEVSGAGLGGELRAVGHIERRLLEAAKLGFETVIMPAAHSLPTTSRLKALDIVRCVNTRGTCATKLKRCPH